MEKGFRGELIDKGSSTKAGLSRSAPVGGSTGLTSRNLNLELLRLSRLQVSEYHLDNDDDDDDSLSQEQSIHEIHFKRGETETIKKVLKEIEMIALKRTSEGFSEFNFACGVLNCFLISYMFGAYPQHLWILYLVECTLLIPRKFYSMWNAKPLNQALYYLDFCWCMNFCALMYLIGMVLSDVTGFDVKDSTREIVFKAASGVACGVLLSANIALPFVACLFHDVNTMTGLFIHLMPPMVMYASIWHTDAIIEAWPGVFNFSYMDEIRYFGGVSSVAGCATALYFMWWIFYISFMLLVGINLPKKFNSNGQDAKPKWDTVYHSTMRQGVCVAIGTYIRGRPTADSLKQMEENNFDLVDFGIYMIAHMTCSLGVIYTVGYLCFSNKYFHLSMIGASSALAVIRGAKRYTYYSTKMYSRTLRKQFANIIDDDNNKAGYS